MPVNLTQIKSLLFQLDLKIESYKDLPQNGIDNLILEDVMKDIIKDLGKLDQRQTEAIDELFKEKKEETFHHEMENFFFKNNGISILAAFNANMRYTSIDVCRFAQKFIEYKKLPKINAEGQTFEERIKRDQLKIRRINLKLSMRNVKFKTGVCIATISRIEAGKPCMFYNITTLDEFYLKQEKINADKKD